MSATKEIKQRAESRRAERRINKDCHLDIGIDRDSVQQHANGTTASSSSVSPVTMRRTNWSDWQVDRGNAAFAVIDVEHSGMQGSRESGSMQWSMESVM